MSHICGRFCVCRLEGPQQKEAVNGGAFWFCTDDLGPCLHTCATGAGRDLYAMCSQAKKASWLLLAALLAFCLAACALADSQANTDLQTENAEGRVGRHLLADDMFEDEEDDFGEVADVDPGDDLELFDEAPAKADAKADAPKTDAKADAKPAASAPPAKKKSNRTKKETIKNKARTVEPLFAAQAS